MGLFINYITQSEERERIGLGVVPKHQNIEELWRGGRGFTIS